MSKPEITKKNMKNTTSVNPHKILAAPITVLELMSYFSNWSTKAFICLGLLKSAFVSDRRFEEARPQRLGTPFVFPPLAAYAQMNVITGLGALSFSGHGVEDAQISKFRL